tara:strand:- start:2038 stop:2685 length:648 start_codon:yes stop_codon:yes gene_type:complete
MNYQNQNAAKVAEFLLQINAVKLQPVNPFKWAAGWNSPIYCDNRKILGHPKIRNFIKDEFIKMINQLDTKPTSIAGVATGGIAIGALIAESLNLPFCYVRSSAKAHGLNNKIEGDLNTDQSVFVIEDLISSGKSSLDAVSALRNFGVNVIGLGAIFTYGFDHAEQNFNNAKCKFKTLTNYESLLKMAVNKQYIKKSDLNTLNQWRKSPSNWNPHA